MTATLNCDYCQLPVPIARARASDAVSAGPIYCCYGCRFAAGITQSRGEHGQANWMLTRLGVAIFLTMAVMVFSMHPYGQDVYGELGSEKTEFQSVLTGLMRYLSLAFATPVFIILGWPILRNAVDQVRRGILATDVLVMIGVGAAFIYSYISTLSDSGVTYYETACMILVLLTFGRWLEAMGKVQASTQIEDLARLMPEQVSIRRSGELRTLTPAEIRPDDELLVAAGERIAADGCVIEGEAHVDEQWLTGESVPVVRGVGDIVRAGTVSVDGALTIRTTAVGSDSALGRLMALLREARGSKGHFERLADRISAAFVPATFVLALIGAALGYRRAGFDHAIMSALAVLLISCPCALGLATPMAIWVSLGRAAAQGVLFRRGEVIEKLARIRAVRFDKTGTLTSGESRVDSFIPRDPSEALRILEVAGGLALRSTHVLSRGIAQFTDGSGIHPAAVRDTRTIAGRGLLGMMDGAVVGLGNLALMRDRSLKLNECLETRLGSLFASDHAIACVGWEDAVRGVFSFSESLRPEAKAAVDQLRQLGCDVAVLTGDHAGRGQAMQTALDVPVYAELLPEDKIRLIAEAQKRHGPTAMVGDGLNDAPALAAADVGIAMGCGADITRDAGDLCLLANDLRTLPWALSLARRTVRTIKLNLFWAFAYNSFGIALALTGWLRPIYAAGLMVVSSLLVVNRSLRLRHITAP